MVMNSGTLTSSIVTLTKTHEIIVIRHPRSDNGDDVCVLNTTNDGVMFVPSVYEFIIRDPHHAEIDVVWKHIWKLKVHERIKVFIWLVKHDWLVTNAYLHRLNLCAPWCGDCLDIYMKILSMCYGTVDPLKLYINPSLESLT